MFSVLNALDESVVLEPQPTPKKLIFLDAAGKPVVHDLKRKNAKELSFEEASWTKSRSSVQILVLLFF